MATSTKRGLAIISALVGGVPTNITAWANGISPQTASLTQNWDEEKIKDNVGFTNAKIARDDNFTREFTIKPTSDTLAHAKSATVFLATFAKLTFSGSEASDFDGDWCLESGSQIQIKNDATAEYTVRCIRYADSTQNTSLNTAPS